MPSESQNDRKRYKKAEYGDRKGRLPGLATKKAYFLRGDLVIEIHRSVAMHLVTINNMTKDRRETMPFADFKRLRRKAYTITEAAILLNRNRDYLKRMARNGQIAMPVGRLPGGALKPNGPGYYSEEQIYEIREVMSTIHGGRPRRDGLITNNTTPTEPELRAAINKRYFVYLQDADGDYVPVFDSTGVVR